MPRTLSFIKWTQSQSPEQFINRLETFGVIEKIRAIPKNFTSNSKIYLVSSHPEILGGLVLGYFRAPSIYLVLPDDEISVCSICSSSSCKKSLPGKNYGKKTDIWFTQKDKSKRDKIRRKIKLYGCLKKLDHIRKGFKVYQFHEREIKTMLFPKQNSYTGMFLVAPKENFIFLDKYQLANSPTYSYVTLLNFKEKKFKDHMEKYGFMKRPLEQYIK